VIDEAAIQLRYMALAPVLDERGRRRFAAAEALAAGRGGVTAVSRITGLARSTITRGLAELRGAALPEAASDRVRRQGGGRRSLAATDATLLADLKDLVEPATRGDPMAPLLWTARSLRNLASGLGAHTDSAAHITPVRSSASRLEKRLKIAMGCRLNGPASFSPPAEGLLAASAFERSCVDG